MTFWRRHTWRVAGLLFLSIAFDLWYEPDYVAVARWGYLTVLTHARERARSAIAWIDPAMVDPRYENFERIENGMTRSEVHDLMGWPPTNVSHWWPMKAHLRDEWRGTRGVIVIDFFGDEHVIRKTFHRANQ